ncbi:B- and T-lymphocyte attenuator-like isoform X2 [Clupea harengus]|uniref:B- and T-lymphocyte attenuator-like isoform X2 n=1 Tax=Clupea harengus TaxID=7950 RepID=A0A6P8GGE5_CLUHA|nr:B- and T-lymphocyte attenuator-like isoform X2 [Clupea harengus]
METLSRVAAAGPALLWLLLTVCRFSCAEECAIEVRVRRNTVLRTAPMKSLTVNCTITWQDCSSEPTVTWCKLLINNDCVKVNSTPDVAIHQERSLTEGNKIVSYLNFHRVEKHDDGLYRCEISGSLTVVSHTINVSVSETLHTSTESPTVTNKPDSNQDWLLYVYVCAACAVVILIVIITCFCLLRGHHITGHCVCTELLHRHTSFSPNVQSRPAPTE